MIEKEEEYFGDLIVKPSEEEGSSDDVQKKEEAGNKTYRGFFETFATGPKKELTLAEAVRIAATPRVFFSKRLAPPFTVCNARVFSGEDFLLKSDIVIPEAAERLSHVAELFGVTLEITYESSGTALWSSDTPTLWRGGHPYGDTPVPIASVMEWMSEIAEKQREQWYNDHEVSAFTSEPKAAKKPKSSTNMTYTYKVGIVKKKKKPLKKKVVKQKPKAKPLWKAKKVVKKKVVKKKKGRSK